MSDLGDRALGSTVTLQFSTAVNGVPTDLAGAPVVSVYGSDSSTPITSGVTLTQTYNSKVGLNNVAIVASVGNGFADGRDYSVVITTGTLGGVSMVGYQVGTFSIGLGNVANLADQAITAAAGVTFPSSVASPTNITAGTITTVTNLTNAATAGDLTATMKTSVQTADDAAITANTTIIEINADVDELITTIGAAGAGLTSVGITSNVKKNTASSGFEFVMTDSTTHLPKTGLTITSQVSIDGAAFGATANTATELSNGVYTLNLAAADVNGNHIMLLFTSTGADNLYVEIITQP